MPRALFVLSTMTRRPEHMLELQQAFLAEVQTIDPSLKSILETCSGQLRAWPVCLRHIAVLHVQHRFRTGRDFPRSTRPGFIQTEAMQPACIWHVHWV